MPKSQPWQFDREMLCEASIPFGALLKMEIPKKTFSKNMFSIVIVLQLFIRAIPTPLRGSDAQTVGHDEGVVLGKAGLFAIY